MTIFEYVIATLLWVAGLAITRLLGDAADTFRTRHLIKLHWIPLVWVALVFLWQMQFLWAIFELGRLIKVWSVFRFGILIFMAILLFVAGALVVPRSTDDQGADALEQFLGDGRWALVFLAGFFLLAFLSNPLLFNISLWELDNVLDLVLGVILLTVQFTRRRIVWAGTTVLFAILSAIALVLLTPATYE